MHHDRRGREGDRLMRVEVSRVVEDDVVLLDGCCCCSSSTTSEWIALHRRTMSDGGETVAGRCRNSRLIRNQHHINNQDTIINELTQNLQ